MTGEWTAAWSHVPSLPFVGTVLTLPGAVAAELLSEPWDVVWIDLEHGALDRAQAQELILGAQATHTLALARVAVSNAEGLVGPMLDAGADGIVAADLRAGAQAEWLVSLMRYPPSGRRGYGPRRSTLRGRGRCQEPDTPRLWVQIETQEGVAAADEIARIHGVDALVVGIADLCTDLGIPIGLSDPRLHDALRAISAAAAQARLHFGVAGPLRAPEQLGDLLDGATVLIHSTDARLCAAAVDGAAQTLRRHANRAVLSATGPKGVSAGG